MQRKASKLLEDIRQAAQRISEWSASRTLDQYRDDHMLRSAVERCASRKAKLDRMGWRGIARLVVAPPAPRRGWGWSRWG